MAVTEPLHLAKISWTDPSSGVIQEHVLVEGATASIGRSSNNDIYIPEQHVSRQHAVINYREGVFLINDLGSANGTFVNDERITDPYPLFSGDVIRLYVPMMTFSATVTDEEKSRAEESGTLITASVNTGHGNLVITSGPQEGHNVPLLLKEITVGRATSNATWEIGLQDQSVSRPHARLKYQEETWILYDLGSANGTKINNTPVTEQGRPLRDGDIITFGQTLVLYRAG